MSRTDSMTTGIRAIFAEEVAAAGGTVSDTFDDGARLFTRSLLPDVREVRPKDTVQKGVALKAAGQDVWVHPYVFRLVCTNGAIMAHAIQTRHVTDLDRLTPEQADRAVREALRACCADDAFSSAAEAMRSAQEVEADFALNLMPLLSRLPKHTASDVFRSIMGQFFQERDSSGYGLMNAVTAVARDTPDPDLRWRLEAFGGGIPASLTPPPVFVPGGAGAPVVEERQLQLV